MAQQTINIGAAPDDHTGESLRSAGGKINANFTELYTAIGASGFDGLITAWLNSRPTTDPSPTTGVWWLNGGMLVKS